MRQYVAPELGWLPCIFCPLDPTNPPVRFLTAVLFAPNPQMGPFLDAENNKLKNPEGDLLNYTFQEVLCNTPVFSRGQQMLFRRGKSVAVWHGPTLHELILPLNPPPPPPSFPRSLTSASATDSWTLWRRLTLYRCVHTRTQAAVVGCKAIV